MIRRILVPLDGSYRAETILPHVVALAKVFDARLDLLHVVPARRATGGDGLPDPLGCRLARADRSRYLEGHAHELREEGLDIWTRVEEGGPAEVIVELLNRGEYDLVGLTPHGAGDDRHLRVGCTAAAIILNARTSLFLVPDASPRSRERVAAPAVYARVMAPVDCSPRSDWSLSVAAGVAHSSGAHLEVVHVLTTPEMVSRLPDYGEGGRLSNRLQEENRREAGHYLQEVAWRLAKPDLQVEVELLESSLSPAEALRERIRSHDIDLVIFSAHGRGASPEWPLGGTAAKLVLWARQPVLILQDLPARRFQTERVSRATRALTSDF